LQFTSGPGGSPGAGLDAADLELIEAARIVMLHHYRPFWHTVAAALRGRDGQIWTGVHLGTTVGRLSICAEAVAMGRAVLDGGFVGDGGIVTAVAVRHPKPEEAGREIAIVSPCGACRELITDYSPDAMVIVPGPAGPIKMPVRELLPLPYQR
jgi:cytidine deaminase